MAFRWCVFGTGPVARKFVIGLRAAHDAQAVVVASRNPENARRFAATLGLEAAESYEAAVAAPGIDAVYVATPPSLHPDHARLCFAAGKPALIEKPFAASAADARAIADAAREAGVFTMEGMWTRFLPAAARLKERLETGEIGAPRLFEGSFGVAERPDPARSLFDPARGGGALAHRGVYPLSLAMWLLGPLEEVSATGRIGATGVEEEALLHVRHAGGALSSTWSSLRVTGANDARLMGEAGVMRLTAPIFRPDAVLATATPPRDGEARWPGRLAALKDAAAAHALRRWLAPVLQGRGWRREAAPYAGVGYGHEADALRQSVQAGLTESPVMPLDDSVALAETMDAARAQIRAAAKAETT